MRAAGRAEAVNMARELLRGLGISLPPPFALLHIYTLNLPERLGSGLLVCRQRQATNFPV